MNGEDEAGVSNEHDDVDGTPEDLASADAGGDETTSSQTAGTDADTDTTDAAADVDHPAGSDHPADTHDFADDVTTDADVTADDDVTTADADVTADDDVADDDPISDDDAEVDLADEDEDATSENTDGELVAVGATAGSARAAARRSAVRSGVTEKKGRATLARDSEREKEANAFQRLGRFLREVVAELRKVIWPHRKQLITYTSVVLVFVVFMTALVFGLDALFARGVLAVFGGG